jgi:hypothetical protein
MAATGRVVVMMMLDERNQVGASISVEVIDGVGVRLGGYV